MSDKTNRGVRSMIREKFSRGTLGFGVLVTVFLLVVFDLIAVFSRLYQLIFVAPVLAGFAIGYYAQGGKVARGRAGFTGVCVGALIIMLLGSIPALILMPSLIAIIWNAFPIMLIVFFISPAILGLLGFAGGLVSGLVAKQLSPPKEMELPPPPPREG